MFTFVSPNFVMSVSLVVYFFNASSAVSAQRSEESLDSHCLTFIELYATQSSRTQALFEALTNYMADRVENMSPPNMFDATACECRRDKTLTIREAAERAILVNKIGLHPLIPIGGTQSDAEIKWTKLFTTWIMSMGARPQLPSGGLACSYER